MLVDSGAGTDLVPVIIWEMQNESVLDIAKFCNERVLRAKNNQDKDHQKVTQLFGVMPTYIMGVFVTILSYLGQVVGISIPAAGVSLILVLA